MKIARYIALAGLVLGFLSCSSEDGPGEGNRVENFDRTAVLINWADNIIVPSFRNFAVYTQELQDRTTAFTAAPSVENLSRLRLAYEEAYIQFQTVSMFEIGEAMNINFRNNLNTYPTDVVAIEQKIGNNSFNLELPSSFDEQGFPALDYLLYGLSETDVEVVQYYSNDANAQAYKDYLQAVSARINNLTATVLNDWEDSFRDTFVASTSTSSTGSINSFTNDYIMYYEKFLRSGKIGIPAGAFTGDPLPGNVEARYAGDLSRALYQKALQSVQDFFNGKHFNSSQTGPSYKQYLDYLNTIKNGEDLAGLINTQFERIKSQATNLDPDFIQQINVNNTLMLQAFDELQKNVVLLKVDMLQALSISVDYVDSDGD